MNIAIKNIDNRFEFEILYNKKILCSSSKQSFLSHLIKKNYNYVWEAYRDARKLKAYHLRKFAMYDMEEPVLTDISAEDMIINHYLAIWRDLRIKAIGCKKDPDTKDKTYKEIKAVVEELNRAKEKITKEDAQKNIIMVQNKFKKLLQKYFPKEEAEENKNNLNKLANKINTTEISDISLIKETLEFYAEKICYAIQEKHNDIYYKLYPEQKEIVILNTKKDKILEIKVNDNLNVESIIPVDKLYQVCPFYSSVFYQRYWKPIVESLGHIYIPELLSVIKVDSLTLPDAPKSNKSCSIEAFDINNKCSTNINIVFKGEKQIWVIEVPDCIKTANKSRYTEQDYINSIVKCIDSNLQSINGRTGAVIQVIPLEDIVELDVDFGSGLGVVRLTEKQIEIVNI
jgi:hypothetical protein